MNICYTLLGVGNNTITRSQIFYIYSTDTYPAYTVWVRKLNKLTLSSSTPPFPPHSLTDLSPSPPPPPKRILNQNNLKLNPRKLGKRESEMSKTDEIIFKFWYLEVVLMHTTGDNYTLQQIMSRHNAMVSILTINEWAKIHSVVDMTTLSTHGRLEAEELTQDLASLNWHNQRH